MILLVYKTFINGEILCMPAKRIDKSVFSDLLYSFNIGIWAEVVVVIIIVLLLRPVVHGRVGRQDGSLNTNSRGQQIRPPSYIVYKLLFPSNAHKQLLKTSPEPGDKLRLELEYVAIMNFIKALYGQASQSVNQYGFLPI